jgi:Subtilase family
MRVISVLLLGLLLGGCATSVPSTLLESESIIDPRDSLPWNQPGYFGSLESGTDYYAGELIAIYNQGSNPPNVDTATGELNSGLARYLRDRHLSTNALKLVDLNGDGRGDAVYGVASTVPPVTVGASPVCGELIAQFSFSGLSLETAVKALLDLSDPTQPRPYLPSGNSLYGISPRGKGVALTKDKAFPMLTAATATNQANLYTAPAFTSSNWSYSAVNAVPGISASGVRVAVLDTGVNPVGSFLLDSPANFVTLQPSSNLPTRNADDDFDVAATSYQDGHGTGVASLIADTQYGLAPDATIIPVKTCDQEGSCNDITVTRGMCYAQSVGADVINLSLGTLVNSPMVRQALREVVNRGSFVTAAAGNTFFFPPPRKNKADYPAAWANGLNGLVSVGAVDQQLRYADFASANAAVELVATRFTACGRNEHRNLRCGSNECIYGRHLVRVPVCGGSGGSFVRALS